MPPLLKWQLQTRGSELLGRQLRVEEVKFAPIQLGLTLRGLSVAAAGGSSASAPQLQVRRVFADFDLRSLWRLAPVLEAVEIEAPQRHVARLADGHYDLDDLLQRFAAPSDAPPSEPQRFALFNVRVADGQIEFDDQPVGRQHALRRIALDLPFLSNLPDDLLVKVEPRLAFELNGSAFESHGRTTPFAEGRASEFDVRFDRLDLSPWWAYLPKTLPVLPQGGALWADLRLRFEQPPTSDPRVDLSGQLSSSTCRALPTRPARSRPCSGQRCRRGCNKSSRANARAARCPMLRPSMRSCRR